MVGELGDTLSGGEKQRIGVARAFLHDAPLLLLDEPTSNLDSLNESIILRSQKKMGKDKTVILVSHRESTMAVAEKRQDCYFSIPQRIDHGCGGKSISDGKRKDFIRIWKTVSFFVMVGYNRDSESKMTVTKGEKYESV